jgi:hypothetical protein
VRRGRTILAVLALLAVPALAGADGKVSFLPTFNVYGDWTDNFLLTADNASQKKLTAWYMSFEPGLHFRYDSFRTEAVVGGSANFLHVFNLRGYDGWPENYNGDVSWAYWLTSSFRASVGDQMVYFTDPRTQPFSAGKTLAGLRTESLTNRMFTVEQYTPAPLSVVEAGYSFITTEFRDLALWDSVQHQAYLTWTQQVGEAEKFIVFYDFNRALFSHEYKFFRRFLNRQFVMKPPFPVALGGNGDFDTHVPGAGLIYQATPTLSFEARSGAIIPFTEENNRYHRNELEWYQRLLITRVFWKMQAIASYSRDFAPAGGIAGAVLTQSVFGNLDERWDTKFETFQEVGYTNYLQPPPTPTNIDSVSASAGATYYFFPWIGLGGTYNRLEQWGGTAGSRGRTAADAVVLRLMLQAPRPNWAQF